MFETWLGQEKETIQSKFGKSRIWCTFLAVLMVPMVLMNLFILLDGGGAVSLAAVIFGIVVMVFVLSLGNYKNRFLRPLLASVRQELSSEESREEFATQMLTGAVCISYQPLPQVKPCEIMAAESYCYMRQPGKSRIIRNSEIRRVVLTKENYATGTASHTHFRWSYALALYAAGNEQKPVWKGYFHDEGELYQAFGQFRSLLPSETDVQDNVAEGKTGSGRKASLWSNILAILIIAAIIILAWARRTGRI